MSEASSADAPDDGHRIAVYPGSFDPITVGHLDILERASTMFSKVVVAVGQHPTKRGYFDVHERVALARASAAHLGGVEVASFSGLVVEFCRKIGSRVIVRGLRAVGDFEPEFQMGLANRRLAPEIETVFLIPRAEWMHVSSSLVREIAGHGGDFEGYVSPPVAAAMRARFEAGGTE